MKLIVTVIEVNGGCNYSCSMCPQDMRTGGRDKRFLRKMNLLEFENNVEQCAKHGLRVVNLEGVENLFNRNLPEYIKIVKKYGAKLFCFSNGFRMHGQFMRDCVDAGLDSIGFLLLDTTRTNIRSGCTIVPECNFDLICRNIREMQQYVEETGSDCAVATYHLITDNDNLEEEKNAYIELVEDLGVKTEIWKMHNWSASMITKINEKVQLKRVVAHSVLILLFVLEVLMESLRSCSLPSSLG